MTISKLKTLVAAVLACVLTAGGVQALAQFGGIGGGRQPAAKAEPKEDDRLAELRREVDRLQVQLDESARKNDALRKQLQDVQAELKAPRAAGPKAAPPKQAGASRGGRPKSARPGAVLNEGPNAPQITEVGDLIVAASPTGDRVKLYDTRSKTTRWLLRPDAPGGRDAPALADRPRHTSVYGLGSTILIVAPGGDRSVVYDIETKTVRPLAPLTTREFPLEGVFPTRGGSVAALMLKGPKITRIAAATDDGTWHTQELREPVEGQASPTVGRNVVAYGLGRYAYAFSGQAGRWDVAELPKGVGAVPIMTADGVTVRGGGHIFKFDAQTGKWTDVDLNAILNAPDDQEKGAPPPGK